MNRFLDELIEEQFEAIGKRQTWLYVNSGFSDNLSVERHAIAESLKEDITASRQLIAFANLPDYDRTPAFSVLSPTAIRWMGNTTDKDEIKWIVLEKLVVASKHENSVERRKITQMLKQIPDNHSEWDECSLQLAADLMARRNIPNVDLPVFDEFKINVMVMAILDDIINNTTKCDQLVTG